MWKNWYYLKTVHKTFKDYKRNNKKCKKHLYPNLLFLWEFFSTLPFNSCQTAFHKFTIHFTLCLISRHEQVCLMRLFPKIQRYFSHHWTWLNIFMMFILMINLLYHGHWTDDRKYIPYISVTHKVLKSCRIKAATWGHDVYEAFSLYKKTCRWNVSYICICIYIYYPSVVNTICINSFRY